MKPKSLLQNSGEPMQKKKFSKPLMERRRRARINDSLNELKVLVLRSLKKDPSRYSKMEKADILELTVKYLKALCGPKQMENDAEHQSHFLTGYNECAREVQLYLLRSADVSPHVKAQMLSRISTSPSEQHQISPLNSSMDSSPLLSSPIIPSPIEHRTPSMVHTPMTTCSKSMNLSSSPKSAFSFSFPSPPASPIVQDHVTRQADLEALPYAYARQNIKRIPSTLECHTAPNFFMDDKCSKLSQNKDTSECLAPVSSWKAPRPTTSCRKELWRPW